MASSIPAARANLHSMLVEAFADVPTITPDQDAVQVTYGPPVAHTEEHEVVAILGVSNIGSEDVTVGGSRQEETYSVECAVKVWDPTCDGSTEELKELDQQAWGHYEAVRAAVQADRTLGGALPSGWATVAVASADAGGSGMSPVPVGGEDEDRPGMGWMALVNFEVQCRARIT